MNDKRKILIVDDEKDLVKTLKFRLEKNNYEVIYAYDGFEGLERAKKENPDLIILDLMLPKKDGYKVCRMLKFDINYRDIPIIILSARKKQEDIDLAMSSGANKYVTKPFDFEDILSKIKFHLKDK